METLPSDTSRQLAGILFLALVTVEPGGLYMLAIVRGRQDVTPFQEEFARAGHAHAGVLLVLALVCQPFVDATHLAGPWAWLARSGVAVSALLMPGGFFFSSMGRGRTEPNRLIAFGARWRSTAGRQPGDPGRRTARDMRRSSRSRP